MAVATNHVASSDPTLTNRSAPASSVGTAPTSAINPAYQATPQQYTAAQSGAIPQVTAPSIMNAVGATDYTAAQSTVDPNAQYYGPTSYDAATSNADTSADAFTRALQNAQAPVNKQQQLALQESLAANGIIGGGGIGAMQQLGLQEDAQFQGNEQSGLLTLKGDEIGQDEFNAGQQNAASQYGINTGIGLAENNATNRLNQSYQNMGAINTAAEQGIQNRIGIAGQDATDALTASADNASNVLNNNQFNANSDNTASQFNIKNLIAQAQGNDATYNQFLQNAQQNANQDWLARLNAQTQINTSGQQGQTSAFQPVYQQPASTPINFSNFGASTSGSGSGGGG